MKISMDKEYTTRDGVPVRIYAIDGHGTYPVHGAIRAFDTETWSVQTWTTEGKVHNGEKEDSQDLIEKPKIIGGWVNIYNHKYSDSDKTASTIWESKMMADAAGCEDRVACIYVTFKEGEGIND